MHTSGMTRDGTVTSAAMPIPPRPFDLTLAREAFANAAELHAEATRRGTPNLTPADLKRMHAINATYAAAIEDGRVADAIEADDAFHQILVDVADDPDIRVTAELLGPRLREMDTWVFTRQALGGRPSSHPAILEALADRDGERAAELVAASFRDAGEALAVAVERRGR
jgi:DNA-binding GntR family transcriptional regulator